MLYVDLSLPVRPASAGDREWMEQVLRDRWGGPVIVSRGRIHDALNLPAFIAMRNGKPCGLATYRLDGAACELVTLDALLPRQGGRYSARGGRRLRGS